MTDTRDKLMAAALQTLRSAGIAGLSARAIATSAGVNQALIFYHFSTVNDLLVEATKRSVEGRVAFYRTRFADVGTLAELLALGRELHEIEREAGNVTVMAQLMAGAQQDERLAAAARYALRIWSAEIEVVIRRILTDSPLGPIVEPVGLARAVSASFIGLELYEGVDASGAAAALDALERLGALADIVSDLGPVARRAVQARVRSVARRPRILT